MIYKMESVELMKTDMISAFCVWAESKLDELFGKGSMTATYMKRGLANYVKKNDEAVSSAMDTLAMFVADENGEIDTDVLFDDMLRAFRQSERHETTVGGMKVEYGEGEVVVHVPHGIMYDMVFGRYGTIRITADDIQEVKKLLKK
jgi:hypothetical protein